MFSFTPPNTAYANVLANITNQNYTTRVVTYTILGKIGVSGATLNWTDGTSKTLIVDTAGNYSLTVSYNFSGTITPIKSGYTFTPASRTYTNVLTSQVNQDYAATPITYSISGNTGMDSIKLNWSDGTAKSISSDSLGDYAITVSYGWTGTVTPLKNGFTFNPVSRSFSGIQSNQVNQNFSIIFSNTPLATAAIQVSSNSFKAVWDTITGAQGYNMDVSTDSNFVNRLTGYNNLNVDTNVTKTITGLVSGTIYYYRVRAYYHNLFSNYSNTIAAPTSLNIPTNLTAVYDTVGIKLKWDYDFTNSNVAGFVIFREGGPTTGNSKIKRIAALVPIDTSNGTSTSYLDKNVVEGYYYNYSVSAYNLSGIISTVGGGGVVSAPVLIPLQEPVNLTAFVQPGGKIVLVWKNKSASETGTIIQRSLADSTNFTNIARTSTNDTSYIDSTVQNGLKYYYRVAAYRDTVVSDYSNTVNVVNITTGVTDLLLGIPKEYKLYQNYPNPFNPSTQIRFALPKQSHVNITIYNILGAEVKRLYNGDLSAGYHEIQFNASRLSSGIYLYRIIAGTYSQVLKMVLMK